MKKLIANAALCIMNSLVLVIKCINLSKNHHFESTRDENTYTLLKWNISSHLKGLRVDILAFKVTDHEESRERTKYFRHIIYFWLEAGH